MDIVEKNKNLTFEDKPSIKINTKELFGVECNFEVFGFAKRNNFVPMIDKSYKFDPANLAGGGVSGAKKVSLLKGAKSLRLKDLRGRPLPRP